MSSLGSWKSRRVSTALSLLKRSLAWMLDLLLTVFSFEHFESIGRLSCASKAAYEKSAHPHLRVPVYDESFLSRCFRGSVSLESLVTCLRPGLLLALSYLCLCMHACPQIWKVFNHVSSSF